MHIHHSENDEMGNELGKFEIWLRSKNVKDVYSFHRLVKREYIRLRLTLN